MKWCLVALLIAWAGVAEARVIEVGPARAVHLPSDAAAQAQDGDTIRIDAGLYQDCAVWRANHLLIEGLHAGGRGVELAGKTCQGKGVFVTVGNDITVRGIAFRGAHVPDGNGAGIRGEGADLTVEASSFEGNENGLLIGAVPGSRIRISDSVFLRDGACTPTCAHGIYVGEVALLRVENCRFEETHQGHHVKSRALRTELVGNTIRDGADGNSSYLVDIPNGGDVVMERNQLEKGPRSENPRVAISLAAEGETHPTKVLIFRGNTLVNDSAATTIFVRNQTATRALLTDNRFSGMVTPLDGPGSVR